MVRTECSVKCCCQDLASSEIEVLQSLRRLLDEAVKDKIQPDKRFSTVLGKAKQRFGTVAFSQSDLIHLYNYAIRVPSPLIDNLCSVHFAVIPATLLRVPSLPHAQACAGRPTHTY